MKFNHIQTCMNFNRCDIDDMTLNHFRCWLILIFSCVSSFRSNTNRFVCTIPARIWIYYETVLQTATRKKNGSVQSEKVARWNILRTKNAALCTLEKKTLHFSSRKEQKPFQFDILLEIFVCCLSHLNLIEFEWLFYEFDYFSNCIRLYTNEKPVSKSSCFLIYSHLLFFVFFRLVGRFLLFVEKKFLLNIIYTLTFWSFSRKLIDQFLAFVSRFIAGADRFQTCRFSVHVCWNVACLLNVVWDACFCDTKWKKKTEWNEEKIITKSHQHWNF